MLKRLSIEHYKGFYDEQSLDFAIPQNGLEGRNPQGQISPTCNQLQNKKFTPPPLLDCKIN
jgi:hypothetical protein